MELQFGGTGGSGPRPITITASARAAMRPMRMGDVRLALTFLVLFALPFAACGLWALFAAGRRLAEGSTRDALLLGCAGLAFALVGFGLIGAAIGGRRKLFDAAAAALRSPEEPWKWREDWAAGHANDTGGIIGSPVVVDRGADNHEIIDDHGRRCHVIDAGSIPGNISETNFAASSKIVAWHASPRIYCNQATIKSRLEHTTAARPCGILRIRPDRHTPVDQAVTVICCDINLGIVLPSRHTAFSVKSNDAIRARGDIQCPVERDWR